MVEARWNSVHHPVHAAGYLLDPVNCKDEDEPSAELHEGLEEVMKRILGTDDVTNEVAAWASWRVALASSPTKFKVSGKVHPRVYWQTVFVVSTPAHRNLKSVAMRIMGLRAGSHAVESIFSAMGHTHSKARNRLLNTRVKKMVYVKVNSRVLQHPHKPWDEHPDGQTVQSGSESETDQSDYESETDQEEL